MLSMWKVSRFRKESTIVKVWRSDCLHIFCTAAALGPQTLFILFYYDYIILFYFFPLPDRLVNLIPGMAIALSQRLKWIQKNARNDKTTWRESESCRGVWGSLSPSGCCCLGFSLALTLLFFLAGVAHSLHFGYLAITKLSLWMLVALQWLAIGLVHLQSAAMPSGTLLFSTAADPRGCFICKRKNKISLIHNKVTLNHLYNLGPWHVHQLNGYRTVAWHSHIGTYQECGEMTEPETLWIS